MSSPVETESIRSHAVRVSRVAVEVLDGVDAGRTIEAGDGPLVVGTADDAALRLHDPTVSRYHVELEPTEQGVVVRDLGSRNGTRIGSSHVRNLLATQNVDLIVGRTRIGIRLGGKRDLIVSERTHFGRLFGQSLAMRKIYTVLERSAPTTVPVLIMGESGTGKELCAWSIHEASPRASEPFEVVDCGALAPSLVESELFGHERGAFTGASGERAGAFERANGGTLFLDEIGELPLEVQPKLLRVLGEGMTRRLGAKSPTRVNVRVVAATNRDLRRMVDAGTFRADLFYRLAVVQLHMPALRERREDISLIGRMLLDTIASEREVARPAAEDEPTWETLEQHHWAGNVREFRNYLEQWLILRSPALIDPQSDESHSANGADTSALMNLPLRQARALVVERFERAYLKRQLEIVGNNLSAIARGAGIDRVTLYRMLERYGMRPNGRP